MGDLYFDENNNLVFSGLTTDYVLCAGDIIFPTPSITSTPSLTPSETPSLTPSETPSITPSETPSFTPTPSSSEIPVSTPSMTPTPTPTIPAPTGFKTEWTVAGNAAARTITLPFTNNGTYNATVIWGDGSSNSTITTYNDADRIHTYASNGTYIIEIKGEAPGWSMSGGFPDASKCTNIINWGNSSGFGGFSYLAEGFKSSSIKSTGIGKIQAKNDLLYLAGTFLYCSSLTGITAGIFDNCINVIQMGNAFTGTQITGVPPDVFKYMTSLTNIYNLFESCSYLTSDGLQSNMFNSLIGLTNISGLFRGCPITYIPTDLFKYNTELDNLFFTFNTTNIKDVPVDLFKYNTKITEFSGLFEGCSSLTGITDSNCFMYATGASLNFTAMFRSCTNLSILADGIFRNPGITSFYLTLQYCNNLQFNPWTFYLASGDTATRFLDKSVSFFGTFNRNSFTGIQGTAPDLWNCDFGTGSATSTGYCFYGTGNNGTSISNYGDIPAVWIDPGP
jgi:hypothetical protein